MKNEERRAILAFPELGLRSDKQVIFSRRMVSTKNSTLVFRNAHCDAGRKTTQLFANNSCLTTRARPKHQLFAFEQTSWVSVGLVVSVKLLEIGRPLAFYC